MHANHIQKTLTFGALALIGAGALFAPRVQAYPTTSPSAKAAARLKFHPPNNWLEHYLGDDRYKIKGGVWKVVTTENDTYYYPAWAPEMLRQKPGLVIGFPNAAAAEEAGYLRSRYPMDSPLLGVTGREPERPIPTIPTAGGSPAGGLGGLFSLDGSGAKVVNDGAAKRVVMSDGKSTVLLPKGWMHIKQSETVPGIGGQPMVVKIDLLAPIALNTATLSDPKKARYVGFGFMQLPPGLNAETIFNSDTLRKIANPRTGRIDSRDSGLQQAAKKGKTVAFGNLRGVLLPFSDPRVGNMPLVIAGKGSTAVIMVDLSRGAKGAKEVIASLRAK